MAYVTLEQLRAEMGIEEPDDDAILQQAIDDAVAYIEAETNRNFEAETDTRYYNRGALGNDGDLYVDGDLLTVTTLTNGDDSSTVIPATEYTLIHRNVGPPYYALRMTTDTTYTWEWDVDGWVSILGTWGYTATCPSDVRRGTLVLAAYFYRQKDSQIFDTTAIPDAGVITIPSGIPVTTKRVIDKYRASMKRG